VDPFKFRPAGGHRDGSARTPSPNRDCNLNVDRHGDAGCKQRPGPGTTQVGNVAPGPARAAAARDVTRTTRMIVTVTQAAAARGCHAGVGA
jgi:hypothetical protein